MFKIKALYSLVFILSMLFVYFQLSGVDEVANFTGSLVVPCITVLYVISVRNKSSLLLMSLLAFSLSELISFLNFKGFYELEYYIGNALYIIAYLALTLEIVHHLNLKALLKYFKMHLLILVILNIYANYFLINIVKNYVPEFDYSMELVYNIFTISLLTVSILNYFFRFDNKSLLLFLGALFITLSEALQIAYYYLLKSNNLKIVFSFLIFMAYYLFYLQSNLKYDKVFMVSKEVY